MPQLTITTAFSIGDRVTLAVDKAHVGLVDGIQICPHDCLTYHVAWSNLEGRSHYAFELKHDADVEVGLHACKETK
jgi:hypothetical protein